MKRSLVFIICSLLVVFSAVGTIAESYRPSDNYDVAEDYRCGNLLIRKGIHSFQVLENCGDPLYLEIYQTEGYEDGCGSCIEKWVYGPVAGYYYILYFRYGVLTELDSARIIW